MATVTNMTNQAISIPKGVLDVNGEPESLFLNPRMRVKGDGSQEEEIDPASSKAADDAGVKKWLKHRLNRAAVSEKRVIVEFGDAVAEETSVGPGDPAPGEVEHWTQTVIRINTITDADELERMYVDEQRPGVKKALEERIEAVT